VSRVPVRATERSLRSLIDHREVVRFRARVIISRKRHYFEFRARIEFQWISRLSLSGKIRVAAGDIASYGATYIIRARVAGKL